MKDKRSKPDFRFEKEKWDLGLTVGGADEVGRGSLAGPVVAACVVYDPKAISTFKGRTLQGTVVIDDSKRLTVGKRKVAGDWIRKNTLAFGIGVSSVSKINKSGIKLASEQAFRRAVITCNKILIVKGKSPITHLLVDAFFIPRVAGIPLRSKSMVEHIKYAVVKKSTMQTAIVKGDQKSFSIASASIIAKNFRDGLMGQLATRSRFVKFGWDKNKGYGTKFHVNAIQKYGITKHHRIQFVATAIAKPLK